MFRLSGSKVILTVAFAAVVLSPAAHAKYTVLYTFACGGDGCGPEDAPVFDSAGNLYGTTASGGTYGYGTVFKLSPDGAETVLYSFKGGNDGAYPYGGVILDKAGNLFGTTNAGGGNGACNNGCGTVFKLAPDGSESVLHGFAGGSDGSAPTAGVVADSSGNLYGTTDAGGGNGCYGGCGTVFKLAHDGNETVLYAFQGASDGGNPYAGLIIDKAGNLYGTTTYAGSGNCVAGCGVIFKVTPGGTETVLHAFDFEDGSYPYSGVTMDRSGNLYGATAWGGPSGLGTVVKLARGGTVTVLHAFPDAPSDGANPYGSVVFDRKGNLYGTTNSGGRICGDYGSSCGTVFKLAPDGTETILRAFRKKKGDGILPYAGLTQDAKGNLYGTTSRRSWNRGGGTVFELTK